MQKGKTLGGAERGAITCSRGKKKRHHYTLRRGYLVMVSKEKNTGQGKKSPPCREQKMIKIGEKKAPDSKKGGRTGVRGGESRGKRSPFKYARGKTQGDQR